MLTPSQVASLPDSLVKLMAELDAELVVKGAELAVRGATAAQIRTQLEAIASGYSLRITGTTAELVRSAVTKTLAPSEALYAAADLAVVPSVATAGITRRAIRTAQREALTLRSKALEARIVVVRSAIEQSAAKLASGAVTRQAATAEAVNAIGDSAASFTYATASGTRTMELESAVRQAIGTLAHRTGLEAQDARMGEMGVEYVLVSQHGGARPEHAEWQGQVYAYPDELEEVTGYPSDSMGLGGINCRHSFSPYLPGVSPDIPEQLDEEAVNEVYEGTQRQRTIERNLRHYKRRLGANDAGLSLDPDNVHLASQAKRDRELIAKWHKESRENVARYDLTRRGYAERPLR